MLATLRHGKNRTSRSQSLSKGRKAGERRFDKLSDRGGRVHDGHRSRGGTIRIPSLLAKLSKTVSADWRNHVAP